MRSGRWYKRIDMRKLKALLPAILGIGLALLFVIQINARLRPLLLELALTRTSGEITAAINGMVTAQAVGYSDLVTLERSNGGEVVALTSNMVQANLLRAQLLDAALSALKELETVEMKIPLGSICNWPLLSGLGPGVNARIRYTGTASAEFENVFFSTGINQTCHQIIFRISADILVLLPGEQYRTTVSSSVCVAETVIVGKVPETYLQIEP